MPMPNTTSLGTSRDLSRNPSWDLSQDLSFDLSFWGVLLVRGGIPRRNLGERGLRERSRERSYSCGQWHRALVTIGEWLSLHKLAHHHQFNSRTAIAGVGPRSSTKWSGESHLLVREVLPNGPRSSRLYPIAHGINKEGDMRMETRMRERPTPEPEILDGVALHPDTFEISQQRVLEWQANHSTRTPYHVLVATYRTYAPNLNKIMAVLQSGIQEKKADMTKYASDRAYVAECQEYVELYEKTLAMIQAESDGIWRKKESGDLKRLRWSLVKGSVRQEQAIWPAGTVATQRSHDGIPVFFPPDSRLAPVFLPCCSRVCMV